LITYSFFLVCEPGAALFGTHFQVKKLLYDDKKDKRKSIQLISNKQRHPKGMPSKAIC
jgi:hypothetical protein